VPRPADPRARSVRSAELRSGRDYRLTLECGHQQSRRLMCVPERVICVECPSEGGFGGSEFGRQRAG
jgi:hypothetical protein